MTAQENLSESICSQNLRRTGEVLKSSCGEKAAPLREEVLHSTHHREGLQICKNPNEVNLLTSWNYCSPNSNRNAAAHHPFPSTSPL